ncbi:type II toxin-antitoxin system HicB family antitoxin [Pseudomonas qingdaonensis]|uniref:type II toxin-antitoxin system HicB family antitoxin n=1 Tax=Pseudomonas qingdaonensis TaxID=2056231 RepID=UPI0028A7AFCE|nr:type II toxin-antitoxin system HicB family antitoxin [Pseudomonas qingdaonensis]
MSKKILEYKGFQGSVEFALEAGVLHGKILLIDDLVTYEADNITELNEAFRESVDDYLATCQELGVQPNKPFSGTFNVRIGAILHRDLARQAQREDKSINDFVREAIDCHLNGRHQEVHHHYNDHLGYETSFKVESQRPARMVHLRSVQ